MKILLLNGETVQVVSMGRVLCRMGHHVDSLCSQRCSSGYTTRFVNNKYICPAETDNEAYRTFFFEHIKKNKYDLIIPMFDTSAEFLSRNKEIIEHEYGIRCAVPPYNLFTIANDKQQLMELCEKHNISHPKTRVLHSSTLHEVADVIGFPAMIKPNLGGGAKGITKVNNLGELEEKFPIIEKLYGTCTLQQYVEQPGYYYNVMIYRDKRGVVAGHTIIKIRRFFPLKGGSSCYCETIEHTTLLKQCEEVLKLMNWVGFADFDVLEDIYTGELKIIEINPRIPSSFQASLAAGVNFGQIIISDVFNLPMPEYEYLVGKQVRWFGLDAMWFLFSPDRFKFSPSWFKFFGSNVSYHDGSWRDPLPMVAGILAGVFKYLNPEFRKSKLDG